MSDDFPIGAIIAFPGSSTVDPPSSNYWALCDGTAQSTTGPYAPLFAVIGFANGNPENGQFNLPDYCGYFMRGTSYDSGNDPGAYTRTKSNPGGNTGDNVGSLQNYDTCDPVAGVFEIHIPHLPDSHTENARTTIGDDLAHWNGNPVSCPVGGGDQETRPKNKYVYYYIKYTNG
jgi:hypothetical protein